MSFPIKRALLFILSIEALLCLWLLFATDTITTLNYFFGVAMIVGSFMFVGKKVWHE